MHMSSLNTLCHSILSKDLSLTTIVNAAIRKKTFVWTLFLFDYENRKLISKNCFMSKSIAQMLTS